MDEPCPPEYTELILCRDVYHCLPSALRAESAASILPHLECLAGEAHARKLRPQG